MKDDTRRTMQQDLIAQCRRASCIDHRFPLALPTPFAHPELGPSAAEWFARKHRRGDYGRFYPLHQAQYRRSDQGRRAAG